MIDSIQASVNLDLNLESEGEFKSVASFLLSSVPPFLALD